MTMMEGFDEFHQPVFTPSPAPAYMTQRLLDASGFIPFEERTTYSPDPNRIADMAAEQRKWELAEAALPISPPMPPTWDEAVPWTGVPSHTFKKWNKETKSYPGATEWSDFYDQQTQAIPWGSRLADQSRWPYYIPPQHPLEVTSERQTWNPQGTWNRLKDTFEEAWWRGDTSNKSFDSPVFKWWENPAWKDNPSYFDKFNTGYYEQYPHYDLYTNWQDRLEQVSPLLLEQPLPHYGGWNVYPWDIF